MKKYIVCSSLFLFNNDVISWIALTVIAGMAITEFFVKVGKAGGTK